MLRPHIVILGAGFGGTYVAKQLAAHVKRDEIDVTIVNKTNYFLFTPLLHEVATGSLTPTSVAEPLREIFVHTGISLCQGSVEMIDPVSQRVHISANGSRHTLPYDYLVVATGAESNYYNIPGAEQFTLPLKSLADAALIRTRIIDAFEKAIVTEDPNERAHLLSFAVVGGGPTGVETAAELSEFIDEMVSRYYYINRECDPDEPRITLVHTGTELLQQFKPSLRKNAAERLEKKGIKLALGRTVTGVSPKGLTLSDSSNIPAATIVWAAGVKSVIPQFEGDTVPMIAGRIVVDEFSRVNGNERIFALGDVAGYIDPHNVAPGAVPAPLPMLAQVTVQQAAFVAKNLINSIEKKELKVFHYHSMGSMVSVGQWFAVGEIFSMKIAGPFTWWLWRTVYLFKFASWKKRIRIAFEWTLNSFYPRDVTKLR
jgi:NADH dehydrogenase